MKKTHYFRRWSVLLFLLATFLLAFKCQQEIPGTSIENTEETQHLFWAVEDLVENWRSDPTLENIDSPRCDRAIADLDLRTASVEEWISELRVYPYTEEGCSSRGGPCVSTCATGVVYFMDDRFRIFLSPGENSDTHVYTTRHEVAHVLSWCTTGSLDYSHSNSSVWGSNGVVRRGL